MKRRCQLKLIASGIPCECGTRVDQLPPDACAPSVVPDDQCRDPRQWRGEMQHWRPMQSYKPEQPLALHRDQHGIRRAFRQQSKIATHIVLGQLISELEKQHLNACCVVQMSYPYVGHRMSQA